MTTSNNPLKDLMLAAGRPFHTDNRSYHTRAVNKLLKTGRIEIKICSLGKHWVGKDGKKYDLKISAAGYSTRAFLKNDISAFYILRYIGIHLQFPAVAEKIKASVSLHTHCERCNGQGFIPAFHYYCNGICFECFGTGFSKWNDLVEIPQK